MNETLLKNVSFMKQIMRVIKQAQLHFREGNSDKIYEVDLCETPENQFLVNFR